MSGKDWAILIVVGVPIATAFWVCWIGLLVYAWHLIVGGPHD